MTKDPAEDLVNPVPVDLNDLPGLNLTLAADEVHVWHAALDEHSADSLRQLLSADDILRADRFHFERDRNHFTIARAILRTLLATYLQLEVDEIRLSYGEKGKPFLSIGHQAEIGFNLAHSGTRAIFAFSSKRELGVDLELIREEFAGEDVAARFFSKQENEALRSLPLAARKDAFFNCWTRKEAYIKARGEGLAMPLDEFDVSLAPGEPAAFLSNHADAREVERWQMRAISVSPGYVAALVVEGKDWKLKTFTLNSTSDH